MVPFRTAGKDILKFLTRDIFWFLIIKKKNKIVGKIHSCRTISKNYQQLFILSSELLFAR